MRTIPLFMLVLFLMSGIYVWQALSVLREADDMRYGSILLTESSGMPITKKGLPGGYMIPYTDTLEGELFQAIEEIEDKRFYEHSGFDWRAKLSGLRDNWRAGSIVRGGSTITEQYIKNRYFRGDTRDIQQKIQEAIIAIWIEATNTKEEILRKYLDNIYFGNHTYGLAGALELYFPHRTVETLTHDEILDLITRIHTPSISEANLEQALTYREQVARRIGWQAGDSGLDREYSHATIELYPLVTLRIQEAVDKYCAGEKEVLKKWTETVPSDICASNTIDLQLTLDHDLQSHVTDIIQNIILRIEGENVTGSAVYIYNPSTHRVLAYVGNRGVRSEDSHIDMITRRRSVGSILKPFIYLLALRDGGELESLILDDTREYPTGVDGRVFIPQNYNPKSYGPIRLREALGNSLNSATVRISEAIGIGRIYNFFLSIGLSLDHDAGYYGYGISLGTVELSLENIVESYRTLTDMTDPDIYLIREALSDPKNRAKTFGISSILGSSMNLPVKTGTSTDFRDNWTVSYHKDAIIGVWVGNTDASPMEDVSGVSGAGPIWHNIAEYMIAKKMIQSWDTPLPTGIEKYYSCLDTHCFQKEQTFMKKPGSIESRPKDGIYFKGDFIGGITEDEKQRWNIQ